MAGRKTAIFCLLLFLLLTQLPFVPYPRSVQASISGDGPPAGGDWVVDHDTTLIDEVVLLNGNLTVTNSSVLTFDNVTLQLNSTFPGQFSMIVEAGSTFELNGSRIGDAQGFDYGFVFQSGSNGTLSRSEVARVGGAANGLVIHTPEVTLTNCTLHNSTFGIILHARATLVNNTFDNNTVGVGLHEVNGTGDIATDNHFIGQDQARVRHYLTRLVEVIDQDGRAVEGAGVELNDTLGENWLTADTDALGQAGLVTLVDREVTPEGVHLSLAPYDLTATKFGRSNTTRVDPANTSVLRVELPLGPDLTVAPQDIQFNVLTDEGGLLVSSHSQWLWTATEEPPEGWEEPDHDDSDWDLAPAPFGAGTNFEETATEWGSDFPDADDQALFRLYFNVSRPASVVILKLAVADGAEAYLNGERVINDLEGQDNDNNRGASHWDYITGEKPAGIEAIYPALLVMGENVLAVRAFDSGRSNFFDAQLEAQYEEEVQEAVLNRTVFVETVVHNRGIEAASDARVQLLDDGLEVSSLTVDLEAGTNRTVTFQWVAAPAGNHTLMVVADPDRSISEENESNNRAQKGFFVGLFGLNLTGEVDNLSIPFNRTARFNFTVTNTGSIGDEASLITREVPQGWEASFDQNPVVLSPGESRNVTLTVIPERGADTGNFTMKLLAVSGYQEPEFGTWVPAGRDNDTMYRYQIWGDDSVIPEDWYEPTFNDSAWNLSAAPFGNQQNAGVPPATHWETIDGSDDYLTIRHRFWYTPDQPLNGARFNVAYNNYFAVYLNGHEVRDCTGWGGGCYNENVTYWDQQIDLDPGLLRAGENLLAVLGQDRTYQGGDGNQWLDLELVVELQPGVMENVLVEILPTHDFDLETQGVQRDHPTNTTVIYPVTIINFGHFNETILTNLTLIDGTGNWTARLTNTSLIVEAGTTDTLGIEVFGDEALDELDQLDLILRLWMEDRPWLNHTYHLDLTAEPPYHEFDLDDHSADEQQYNGTTVTHYIEINNRGNVQDLFIAELSILNSSGDWDVSLTSTNLSIHAYSEGELGIIVEAAEELRFWDFINLSVELSVKAAPWLEHTFLLNLTPIFDDHNPPRTRMVDMDGWVREPSVNLSWEVTHDTQDTTDFYIYRQTEAPDGTLSGYSLWGSYPVTMTSAEMEVEHGWGYYLYSLGQDDSKNLELDPGSHDIHFMVDLEPPQSQLWVEELGQGEVRGLSNETELTLNWEPVNFTATTDTDYDYTIETRNRTGGGLFNPWRAIAGLVSISLQQADHYPQDGRIYQYRSIATDQAGWIEDKNGWDVQITIDATPPATSLDHLSDITTTSQLTMDILYDIKDDVAKLQVQYTHFPEGGPPIDYTWLNGGNFQGATIPDELTFSDLSNGRQYLFRLAATDANNNRQQLDDLVEYYVGNGSHYQSYQLSKLPLPAPSVPYSHVSVIVKGVEDERLLEYFAREDMPASKNTAFHLDYKTGTIHFGDPTTGYIPPNGTRLYITYDAYDAGTIVDTSPPEPPGTIHHKTFEAEAGTATLSWHPSTSKDVEAYRLEQALDRAGPWSEVDIIPAPTENRDINDIVVQGLSADTTYYFRVSAIDRADWESEPNDPVTVNENPITSDGDDDDGGSDAGVLPVLLLVVLVIAGAIAFMVNKRKAESAASEIDGPIQVPAGTVVPVTDENDTSGNITPTATTTTVEAVIEEPGDGAEEEHSCSACGTFYEPGPEGQKMVCPACGQIPDEAKIPIDTTETLSETMEAGTSASPEPTDNSSG